MATKAVDAFDMEAAEAENAAEAELSLPWLRINKLLSYVMRFQISRRRRLVVCVINIKINGTLLLSHLKPYWLDQTRTTVMLLTLGGGCLRNELK